MKVLSVRELEVIAGIGAGKPNKVIAQDLGISESTVKVHVHNIFRKLQLTNRVQVALWSTSQASAS